MLLNLQFYFSLLCNFRKGYIYFDCIVKITVILIYSSCSCFESCFGMLFCSVDVVPGFCFKFSAINHNLLGVGSYLFLID